MQDGYYFIDKCFAVVVDNRVIDCCDCRPLPITIEELRHNLDQSTYIPITIRRFVPHSNTCKYVECIQTAGTGTQPLWKVLAVVDHAGTRTVVDHAFDILNYTKTEDWTEVP